MSERKQTGFRCDGTLLREFQIKLKREGTDMSPVLEGWIREYMADERPMAGQRAIANTPKINEVLSQLDLGKPLVDNSESVRLLAQVVEMLQTLPDAVASKLQAQERTHGDPERISPELRELRQTERALLGRNAYKGVARTLGGLSEDKLRLIEALAWKLKDLDLSKKDTINAPLTNKLRSIADEYDKEAARKRDRDQRPKTGTDNR